MGYNSVPANLGSLSRRWIGIERCKGEDNTKPHARRSTSVLKTYGTLHMVVAMWFLFLFLGLDITTSG